MPGVPTRQDGSSSVINGIEGSRVMKKTFFQKPSFLKEPMVVGCPKEVKDNENRVSLVPSAAAEYVANGHKVVIEKGAGEGSGFSDEDYLEVGCHIVPTIQDVYAMAQMIVKVKEPAPSEYNLIREGQVIFAYFHFAAERALTEAMLRQKAVCIAYETVEASNRSLPLLTPMSEIAGRMSVQEGAKFLEKPMGGRGVLLSGVPGVHPARIVILGGGVVGFNAAKMAAGTGADVVVMDINVDRLRYLDDVLPKNCRTLFCSAESINDELKLADLVVGAVLIPGSRAPKLVRREHLRLMKPGTLVVDVAVDQGGCFETTRVTTHKDPTYVEDGIMHYCVGNMPGAVPMTSSLALNNATLKYGLQLANKGWYLACLENEELKKGLNVVLGLVLCKGVADAYGMVCTNRDTYLKEESETADMSMQKLAAGLKKLSVVC